MIICDKNQTRVLIINNTLLNQRVVDRPEGNNLSYTIGDVVIMDCSNIISKREEINLSATENIFCKNPDVRLSLEESPSSSNDKHTKSEIKKNCSNKK